MAILRAEEIREMSREQMEEKLSELQRELFAEMAKKASGGSLENPGRVREIRRTIARIKTIMREVKE